MQTDSASWAIGLEFDAILAGAAEAVMIDETSSPNFLRPPLEAKFPMS